MLRLHTVTKIAMLASSALSLSSVSHAEIIAVKWDTLGKFERTQQIAPGKFVEFCDKLPKDSTVTWQFKASAPLNFNVHFHQGKAVTFAEKQDSVSELQGTLVAPRDEDYCWMWTNKGDAASNVRALLAKVSAKR